MSQSLTVRPLRGAAEEKRFAAIARYCFNDQNGWTGRIFPLRHGDRAWGAFRGGTLESGIVTRAYQARLFGAWRKMSGISLVETPPEYRNRSNISALFARILPEEFKAGHIVSTLFPFSFRYYEHYGYGYLGGPHLVRFTPETIAVEKPATGDFHAWSGTAAELAAYHRLTEAWAGTRLFGIKPRPLPLREFSRDLEWSGDRLVFYRSGRNVTGYVRLNKQIVEQYASDLDVRKIAWADDAAFRALLYLLKTHRGQIREIRWYMPADVPLHLVLREPRFTNTRSSDWMVRPLDLPSLLALKAKERPTEREIVFSVRDDQLPRNSGSYRIRGDKVSRADPGGGPLLPLPLLAALLSGGCSVAEARLSGALGPEALSGAEEFFTRDSGVFFNEFF